MNKNEIIEMNKTFIAVAAALALTPLTASAELSIKGWTIGQEMTECPAGFEERSEFTFLFPEDGSKHVVTIPGTRRCLLENTTYANISFESLYVNVFNDQVVTITLGESDGDVESFNQLIDSIQRIEGEPLCHGDQTRSCSWTYRLEENEQRLNVLLRSERLSVFLADDKHSKPFFDQIERKRNSLFRSLSDM